MAIWNIVAVTAILLLAPLSATAELGKSAAATPEVGLYKVFEKSIENTKSYSNKFIGVDLKCSYTSPSGKKTDFIGFFDGDGKGGGSASSGSVWKIRFMPDELGTWKYEWSWSDGTAGGQGEFTCVSAGAGKGVLRPYKENPRWFAYNGTDPVYLKSYYDPSMRPFFQWPCVEKYYQTLIDNGYNHLQVNWLLPSIAGIQWSGCPASSKKALYSTKGKASSSMNLDVWKSMEVLLNWLNDRNVGLFMFLGFDGGRNKQPQAFKSLSDAEKDFFVRYVVARMATYQGIMWNYVWEVPGNREDEELGCLRLVKKYDVFDHLRTYQDEKPLVNFFHLPEYNFAGVENHNLHDEGKREPQFWGSVWTHHISSLVGYIPGKPVYQVEGNLLWRHYWANRLKADGQGNTQNPDKTRQAAWAVATAAASYTWNGQTGLSFSGSNGIPFNNEGYVKDNPYWIAAQAIDIQNKIMNEKVAFYRMTPHDSLLPEFEREGTLWCLAEPGHQYLVFSLGGQNFSLKLDAGNYTRNEWIDTKTGTATALPAMNVTSAKTEAFTPPNTSTDWVLLVRKDKVLSVNPSKNRNSVSPTPNGNSNKKLKTMTLDGRVQSPNSGKSPSGIVITEEPGTGDRKIRRMKK